MDSFWVFVAIWAGFGALACTLALWKLGLSRMSYGEARQLLSAIVSSLSTRVKQNELATKQLLEELEIIKATQSRVNMSHVVDDRELRISQEGSTNLKSLSERLGRVETNLGAVREECQKLRLRVERFSSPEEHLEDGHGVEVGIVTERSLRRLTETERTVLELLVSGPKPAPEIGRVIGKSREHSARVMKELFEHGYVERETQRQPYEYRLNDRVKEAIAGIMRREASQSIEQEHPPSSRASAQANQIGE